MGKIKCLICKREIDEDFIQQHYDEHKIESKGLGDKK